MVGSTWVWATVEACPCCSMTWLCACDKTVLTVLCGRGQDARQKPKLKSMDDGLAMVAVELTD